MMGEGPFLKRLFCTLNTSGIRYAVMRNYETLPFHSGGSDLDILVHPLDCRRAKQIFFEVIKRSNGTPIGYVDVPGFLKIFALGSFKTKDERLTWWGLCLDISFGLFFEGAIDLLEWRKEQIESHNNICVLSRSLANVLGVLKEVLHNNQLPLRYIEPTSKFGAKEWKNISLALAPMGKKAFRLFRLLCNGKIGTEPSKDEFSAIRKALRYHALSRAPFGYMKRRSLFEWSKVQRYIAPPGVMFAFLGVDGSGKSTIIEAVRPILEKATHKALYVHHLRPNFLPPLARLKGNKAVDTGPVLDPHSSTPSGFIGSLLRITYLTLNYILGYWLLIRPKIAKQPAIVIFAEL